MLRKLNLSGHENAKLNDLGFEFPGVLHVDLNDPETPEKITAFLVKLGITSEDQVTVALPGLAPLAAIVVASLHGLTGNFPDVQLMVKSESGFVPGLTLDLDEVRTHARANRPGSIIF